MDGICVCARKVEKPISITEKVIDLAWCAERNLCKEEGRKNGAKESHRPADPSQSPTSLGTG
jgi:hypothetical protein